MTREETPRAVEALDRALADWLSSFTAPGGLAGEVADACAAGAAWPAAVAAVAAREAGWAGAEAMAWGIAVGAQAGALEAARRSLADGSTALLAADALVAAAHEALASLPPARLLEALDLLEDALGDGGPWLDLAGGGGPAADAAVGLALAPLGGSPPSPDLAALSREARAAGGRPATSARG